jgi:putative ABC transport system substrate-binding protein
MGRFSRAQVVGAATIVVVSSVVFLLIQMQGHLPAQQYTIGLVWAPSSKGHEQLGSSFMDIVRDTKQFVVKSFAARDSSDVLSITATCDAALSSDVDLLFSLGYNCTRTLAQLSKKRKSTKPGVFIGVSELVASEVVESLEKPGGVITGVYDAGMYFTHPIDILLTLKPQAKSILLPYGFLAADSNEPYAVVEKQIAAESDVYVELFPIEKAEDALSHITSVIDQHDSVMYLEADVVGPCGSGLGKLATQHSVTLFACSPDAKDTAAFTYCAEFKYSAQAAYKMMLRILINREDPANIPVEKLKNNRVLTINVECCKKQGMPDINLETLLAALHDNPKLIELRERIVITHSETF